MNQSMPSVRRTVAACGICVAGGLAALAWKVLRDASAFESYSITRAFLGVVPNLLPTAVLPVLIFLRPRPVRFMECVKWSAMILVCLTIYEIAQFWIPSRTFDVADILASFLGAGIGCLVCWQVFFRWLGSPTGIGHERFDRMSA